MPGSKNGKQSVGWPSSGVGRDNSKQGAGWPSKTGNPSGGGRDNNSPKGGK